MTHTPPFVEGCDVDVSLQTQSPHFGSRALNEDYCVAYEPLVEYACRKEDLVSIQFELDDDLAIKAREGFEPVCE